MSQNENNQSFHKQPLGFHCVAGWNSGGKQEREVKREAYVSITTICRINVYLMKSSAYVPIGNQRQTKIYPFVIFCFQTAGNYLHKNVSANPMESIWPGIKRGNKGASFQRTPSWAGQVFAVPLTHHTFTAENKKFCVRLFFSSCSKNSATSQ